MSNDLEPKTNPTSEYATVPCQDCKLPVSIRQAPIYFLHNLAVSTVIVTHEEAIVCPNCNAIYGLGVNEAKSRIVVQLKQVQKGSLIASPHSNGHGLILPS